jgi:protein-tyrosine phosphatase
VIDFHVHVLPGVDDGPETLEEAAAMCRLAYASGCRRMVATPHRRRDEWRDRSRAELAVILDQLKRALDVPLELWIGAEVRVDSELPRELSESDEAELPTLGDSRAILLELEPRGIGPDPVVLVADLVERGFRPIIAHPELTPFLRGETPLVAELAAAGASIQITAMSVTGEFGRAIRAAADELVDHGLVHAVASDGHRLGWRPPVLSHARAEVVRHWGEELATALFETNARKLLGDRLGVASHSEARA